MTMTSSVETTEKNRDGSRKKQRGYLYLALGPIAGLAAYFALATSGLSTPGRAVVGIAVLMGIWWVSEALPIGVTSLVPIVGFPLVGAMTPTEAAAPFANPSIFLFLGGFLLALAVQSSGLDRRIAITTVSIMGSSPGRVIAGFMIATGFVTMFVSNGATTVMMLPIALAVISLVKQQLGKDGKRFATGLLVSVAYAATIGSLASLIGAPVNLIVAGYIEENTGIQINFLTWMAFGVPFALVLMCIAWALITKVFWRVHFTDQGEVESLLKKQRSELGRLSADERWCITAFGIACAGWIILPLVWPSSPITDTMVALVVGTSLFMMPSSKGGRLLTWKKTKDLPWDVLLLFGAGFSLSAAVSGTDLNTWIGTQFSGLSALPMILVLIIIIISLTFMTEFTSSVAVAATFVPIVGGIAEGLGFGVASLVVAAGYACLMAFALPVGTPPNAVIFASGEVSTRDLIRAGLPMNFIGVVVLVILAVTLIPAVVG